MSRSSSESVAKSPRDQASSSDKSDSDENTRREPRVKRQHRPRQAVHGEALSKAALDMAHQLAGAKDALSEMKEEVEEPEPINQDSVPRGSVLPDRFIYSEVDTSMWPLCGFYSFFLLVACLSAFADFYLGRLLVVCLTALACYFCRRMLRAFYLNDSLLRFVPQVAISASAEQAAGNTYASPITTLPCSGIFCGVFWLASRMVAFEDGLTHIKTGVCRFVGYTEHELVFRDVRLSNQRANKAVSDRVTVVSYDAWNFETGIATRIISSDSIADQVAVKLRNLPAKERPLQADNMASKVTNLMVSGHLFPELARGSARMAIIACSNRDYGDEAFVRPSMRTAGFWEPFLGLMMAICFSVATTGLATASAFDTSEALLVLLFAPLAEELLKTALTRLFGFRSRVPVSFAFGLVEWAIRGFDPHRAIAVFVHLVLGFASTRNAVVLHFGWNAFVLAFQWWISSSSGHKAAETLADLRTVWDEGDPQMRAFMCNHRLEFPYSEFFALPGNLESCEIYRICTLRLWECNDIFRRANELGSAFAASLPTVLVGLMAVTLPISVAFAVGYRVDEVPLPPLPAHGAKIKLFPSYHLPVDRQSHSCTLGFDFTPVAPVFPDFAHGPTALHGCLLRFCKNPPPANRQKLRQLKRFVEKYVKRHYIPLPADADVSLETWLAATNYTEARKNELRKVWDECEDVSLKDIQVDGFIKRESYEAFKPARGINSRSDRFKCATGPYFKLIEEQVYAQPCWDGVSLSTDPSSMGPFIKHIPVHLRPQFLMSFLGAFPGCYYETDYSQFEKHFTPDILMSVEMVLYKHMLQNFPATYSLIQRTMCGVNKCVYRHFCIKVKGRRMSGEMCTSLGNGFTNLMLFKFAAHLKGGEAVGVVEGDDALFYSSVELTTKDFADLGFDIKILCHSDLFSTCFCGMTMSRDFSLLRDPRKVLLKFAWTFSPFRNCSKKVRLGLLRAKALSLAYECPKCPILWALSRRVLVVTSGIKARFDAGLWQTQLQEWVETYGSSTMRQLACGPSMNDRVDFYLLYGIPPALQLAIEAKIERWNGDSNDDPLICSIFESDDIFEFRRRFVFESVSVAVGSGGDL